jgi:hypothetical protein
MTKQHAKLVRNLIALIVPLTFTLGLNGCPTPTPVPAPIPNAFQLTGTGNTYVEMTAAVSPPWPGSGPCKDGMILVASGAAGGWPPQLLMGKLTTPVPASYDLAGWDGAKWAKRGSGSIDAPPTGATEAPEGSDNQAGRLANGDLLFTWNGSTKAALPDGSHPSWWNDWGTAGNVIPEGLKPRFPSGQRDGYRAAQVIWRYSCTDGKWVNTGMLDGGVAKAIDKNGVAQAGYCVQGAPWVSGFDRPELYVDPWGLDPSGNLKNQRIYFSTRCSRSSGDDDSTQVFMSPDSGATWTQAAIRLSWTTPVVMTSTNNGRLFMFQPSGTTPILHWSDDHGASLASPANGYDISYVLAKPKPPEQPKYYMDQLRNAVTGVGESRAMTISLARTGKNAVLAVYPSLEVGTVDGKPVVRQVAAVVWVITKESKDEAPIVVPIKIIRAEAATGSVLMPTFIQDNRPDATTTTNLLYWIETKTRPPLSDSPDPVKMQARYIVFNGIVPETETLLSDAAGWETKNRAIYDATGDYMKGAFYLHNGTLNFVAVWPQTSPADPNKLANQVFARIITLKPSNVSEPKVNGMIEAKPAPISTITKELKAKSCEICVAPSPPAGKP